MMRKVDVFVEGVHGVVGVEEHAPVDGGDDDMEDDDGGVEEGEG